MGVKSQKSISREKAGSWLGAGWDLGWDASKKWDFNGLAK